MFVLWNGNLIFMKIENAVYTSFQNSTFLFINGLIFDIISIQNNRSLSMIERFHSFVTFSLSLSKITESCLAMPRKLYNRRWSENAHVMANT